MLTIGKLLQYPLMSFTLPSVMHNQATPFKNSPCKLTYRLYVFRTSALTCLYKSFYDHFQVLLTRTMAIESKLKVKTVDQSGTRMW